MKTPHLTALLKGLEKPRAFKLMFDENADNPTVGVTSETALIKFDEVIQVTESSYCERLELALEKCLETLELNAIIASNCKPPEEMVAFMTIIHKARDAQGDIERILLNKGDKS